MSKFTWSKSQISTPDGMKEAIEPIVITASRATDIPAFYTDWFFERFREGYCVWMNPFNQQPMVVSLRDVRAAVFWSKNPTPLMERLAELDALKLSYYFQFTLNDYDAEGYEPGVPPLRDRLETFQKLSRQIGAHRVVWRHDPILLSDDLSAEKMAERIESIARKLSGFTQRLVFSFVIVERYPKVAGRLRKLPRHVREPSLSEKHELAGRLAEIGREYGLEVAACCEEMDFSPYGILPSRCVDGELLLRLAEEDNNVELAAFLTQSSLLPIVNHRLLKDTGQRKNCGCILSKDIGQYNTCPHYCVYCYANRSVESVERNRHKTGKNTAAILEE